MDIPDMQPAIRITDSLFQLGIPSYPTYLSLGDDGMLIDGGTGPTTAIIIKQIEALGVDPQRIKYIIPTHTHGDHIGSIPRLRQIWPDLKVLAGTVAAKLLRRENLPKELIPVDRIIGKLCLDAGYIQELPENLDRYDFHVDQVVDEGERICLGKGITWHIYNTPGHSPCHISLYEEREETLVIGDMTGYHDPRLGAIWPNYFSSMEDYCNSIRRMMDLEPRRGLLSHNGLVKGNVRDYFVRAMDATEEYHFDLLKRLSKGEDPEKIAKDKADWVASLGPLAAYKTILILCKVLLERSRNWKIKPLFYLPEAAAA